MPKVKLNIFGLTFLILFGLILLLSGKLFEMIFWAGFIYWLSGMLLTSLAPTSSPKPDSTKPVTKSKSKPLPASLAKKLARRR